MSTRITGVIVLTAVVFGVLLGGCAIPSGGCPFCGYPPGMSLDGQDIRCQRCGGTYRVYMDGSVAALNRPVQQYPITPTNNTGATQDSLNQNGLLILEGLSK